mmetsp:Transcript_109417/g.320279  ORF Transcript_109417/g.320279 Transcript_109417/m.320279 type:complete len:103 (+) Transcript_109417:292-600(+)
MGPAGSIIAGHLNTIGGEVFTTARDDTAVGKVIEREGLEVAGTKKVGMGTCEATGGCTALAGEVVHRAMFGRGRGMADCTRDCTGGDIAPGIRSLWGGDGDL